MSERIIDELKKLYLKEGDILLVRLDRENYQENFESIGRSIRKFLETLNFKVVVLIYPFGVDISTMKTFAKKQLLQFLKQSLKDEGENTKEEKKTLTGKYIITL